jgi:DNA ligase-1
MASPTKRRKLNDSSKASPVAPRGLEFFFEKQKEKAPLRPANGDHNSEISAEHSESMDEELARKLQAEWDQEDAGSAAKASMSGTSDTFVECETSNGQVNQDIKWTGADTSDPVEALFHSQRKMSPAQMKMKNTLSLQATGSEEDGITSSIPFDESPLTFHPLQYVSRLQSHWAADGGNASYALLTRCFVLVNSTQSRIKIVDTVVNFLRVIIEADPSSLLSTVRAQFMPS